MFFSSHAVLVPARNARAAAGSLSRRLAVWRTPVFAVAPRALRGSARAIHHRATTPPAGKQKERRGRQGTVGWSLQPPRLDYPRHSYRLAVSKPIIGRRCTDAHAACAVQPTRALGRIQGVSPGDRPTGSSVNAIFPHPNPPIECLFKLSPQGLL